MKTFEYVTILFSIMLGFCFTQMAANFVLVVQHFHDSNLYAPSILWNAAALVALLGHWVNFHKAGKIEKWNALKITVVFLAPLIYFIPAQLLTQSPLIDGQLDFEVIFELNKNLIYGSVILFVLCTMAQHYLLYGSRGKFIYSYYSVAIIMVVIALIADSKTLDHVLAGGILISEAMNHYVFNPLKLAE